MVDILEGRVNLGGRFNQEKAINAILWIASFSKNPTFHQIIKLMYLADKEHVMQYGRLIFGDSYVARKQGPEPRQTSRLLKPVQGVEMTQASEEVQTAFQVTNGEEVIPLKPPDLGVFSESEPNVWKRHFRNTE